MKTYPSSKTLIQLVFCYVSHILQELSDTVLFQGLNIVPLPFSFNVKPRAFFIFLNSLHNCPVFTVHFFKTHHFMTSSQPRPDMYYFPIRRAGLLVRATVCQGSCVPFPKRKADQLIFIFMQDPASFSS